MFRHPRTTVVSVSASASIFVFAFVPGLVAWQFASSAPAQRSAPPAATDADLQVDGIVQAVYSRQASGNTERLVRIGVRRAEVVGGSQRGVRYPAVGDPIYVVIDAPARRARRFNRNASVSVPDEGAEIRAYLSSDQDGAWRAAADDWFEPLADRSPQPDNNASGGSADTGRTGSALGMSFEVIELRGRLALRVTQLEPNGIARGAGLEIGDLIIGVNGQGIDSLDELQQRVQGVDKLDVAVIDVNSGRLAEISVNLPGRVSTDATSPPQPEERPWSPRRPTDVSLGITAERVSLGLRTALKVSQIVPNSPAAKAGLEVGDVIVKANGVSLTGPEQLVAVLRKSDGALTLSVRDVRSGREVPVEVDLSGGTTTSPRAAEPRRTSDAQPGRMGVVTELAFYDVEAAVKVTEVEPGSPADRAGLVPGVIILDANGKKVLHPNDLTELERVGNRITLTVVDPRNGRKQRVPVDLGR